MLAIIFGLPLVGGLACLILSNRVPTRWLGIGAAAACALAALLLAFAAPAALALPDYTWAAFEAQSIVLSLRLEESSRAFALLALGGGAVALLSLAASLPASLRGFGGLFAALLLLLLAVLAGLALPGGLLLPVAWALAALLSFVALRASGAQTSDEQAPPLALLAGMLGALGLLGAALTLHVAGIGAAPGAAVLLCWVLVALLQFGAPPFHQAFDEPTSAPAGIAALLLPLGLPLLAGATLIRLITAQALLTPAWRVALVLAGLLTLLGAAAGALRERRLRRIVGWQLTAQLGLLLPAVALSGASLAVAAPALLINAALTALVAFLVVALVERHAGTDDLTAIGRQEPQLLPGLALVVAAASAVGLPGTWGFWARRWLLDELLRGAAWSVGPLLAGSALLVLAHLAPLASYWRAGPPAQAPAPRTWATLLARLGPALAALPLLVLGVAPHLTAPSWNTAPLEGPDPVVLPDLSGQLLSAAAIVLLLVLPLLIRYASTRRSLPDPDLRDSGVATPQALGESLAGLVWISAPGGLFGRLWQAALWLSRGARRSLALFEQRYYLAGFMIALVVVILLLL